MEIFFPKEIYKEPQYIKQVLGDCAGSTSWLMLVLPPHTPWGCVAPSLLANPEEMLGTPSLIALRFQFKDWESRPGHSKVHRGSTSHQHCVILLALF